MFAQHFAKYPPGACQQHVVELLARTSDLDVPAYGASFRLLIERLRTRSTLPKALRTTITQMWASVLALQYPMIPESERSSAEDSPLTPIEIELAQKALQAGLSYTDLFALPRTPSVTDGSRWAVALNRVLDQAFAEVQSTRKARPHAAALALNLAVPNGHEDPTIRNMAFSVMGGHALVPLLLSHRLDLTCTPSGRRAFTGLPIFCHYSPSTGLTAALHVPNVFAELPKTSFLFRQLTPRLGGSLFAHPASETVLISRRQENSDPLSLSSGSFPATFTGPTLLGAMHRMVSTLQQLTSYQFRNSVDEIAAYLAAQILNTDHNGASFTLGCVSRTQVILPVPEHSKGLRMDRAVGIYLTKGANDNLEILSRLFSDIDSQVSCIP